jgi:hypothetical protein
LVRQDLKAWDPCGARAQAAEWGFCSWEYGARSAAAVVDLELNAHSTSTAYRLCEQAFELQRWYVVEPIVEKGGGRCVLYVCVQW